MKFVLSILLFVAASATHCQVTAIPVRGLINDTCKMGVDTVMLGKTSKALVIAPRIELEHFDVIAQDTMWRWIPRDRTVRYWICYKVTAINSNCPWLSFQRYTPTKCD